MCRERRCRESKETKFNSYKLRGSIHTFQIVTEEDIDLEALKYLMEVHAVAFFRVSVDGSKKILVLNLNKIKGDIFSFVEFCRVFEEVKNFLGINGYHLQRCDFRLDSYEKDFYKKFFKIHRYLLAGFNSAFSFRNAYEAQTFFSKEPLSLALKGRDFQLEYYNRATKSFVTGNISEPAQARLEIRSLSRIWGRYRKKYPEVEELNFIKQEFQKAWTKRLEEAIESLETSENQFNGILLNKWQEDQTSGQKTYRNHNDFLRENQEQIFTRRQAVRLLAQMEIRNPKKAVDNFVDRYKPELFLKREVLKVRQEIQKSIKEYFRN